MQDANTQTWTETQAKAETLSLGPGGGGWHAPIPTKQAFAADLGPKSLALEARANHGRWIVECPDCNDAQFACPDDRRFMCGNCANAVVGGFWRPVVWPKDRAKVEELLMARPDPTTRNWLPHETVAQLKAENKERGL